MSLFIPSNKIITQVGSVGSTQRLALSSREWFELQTHVQAVLNLPFDLTSFQIRYGDASSGLEMKECFDAMRNLRAVMANYGNPRQLRSKTLADPNFFASDWMPENDIYAAVTWTLQRSHQNAAKMASVLSSIPENARGLSDEEIVSGIKDLFLATDQIVDELMETQRYFDSLVKQIEALEQQVQESQAAMKNYTDRSSKTRTSLDTEIGDLNTKIAQLEKDRDAAYDKWLDLTIAAITVSTAVAIIGVAVTVILAVVSLPAGAASGGAATGVAIAGGLAATAAIGGTAATILGTLASNARSSYEDLCSKLEDQEDMLKKRVSYRNDLGALDRSMQFSLPASNSVSRQIREMRYGWNSLIEEIKVKVGNLSVDNLRTGPWLKSDEMNRAALGWTGVDNSIKRFFVDSFVDYQLVDFGQPLPADDPKWREKVTKSAA